MLEKDHKLGGGLAIFWDKGVFWTRGRLGPSVSATHRITEGIQEITCSDLGPLLGLSGVDLYKRK